MSAKMKSMAWEFFIRAKKAVRDRITKTVISARCWIGRGKETLCNTGGAGGAMDVALGLIIGVVLALVVLEALKNLFNVDIMPQVTSKIDGMWS